MKVWQRRIGMGIAALAALVLVLVGGAYALSATSVGAGHDVAAHPFDASIGDAVEGARLGNMFGCTHCHTPDLGGQLLIDGMPFARVPAPNITAGAPGGALTDEEFERAMRHGIARDGRKLFVMPSAEYTYLSDQDIADMLAWIRTLPAVERELPARTFGPIGRTMVALGRVPFQPDLIARDPEAQHLVRPAADDPLQLGYYLTRLCTGCHGLDLAGAPPLEPGLPPGANLTPAGNLSNWSFDEFRAVFATGRTPEGKELDPNVMPWPAIGQAQPHELEAIWEYLQTIPAKELGGE
ncbi:MAG: cytochrome c [Gemmatimonadota bacterium]